MLQHTAISSWLPALLSSKQVTSTSHLVAVASTTLLFTEPAVCCDYAVADDRRRSRAAAQGCSGDGPPVQDHAGRVSGLSLLWTAFAMYYMSTAQQRCWHSSNGPFVQDPAGRSSRLTLVWAAPGLSLFWTDFVMHLTIAIRQVAAAASAAAHPFTRPCRTLL